MGDPRNHPKQFFLTSSPQRVGAATQSPSVKVLGFRGPLGAFIVLWGGIAMLTSAPFDNWWHNAYGLDVTVVSPPHILLMTGMVRFSLAP